MPILRKMIARYTDHISPSNGNTVWLAMQWHPVSVMLYVSAIAAISAEKYDMAAILTAGVNNQGSDVHQPCFIPVISAVSELDSYDVFKKLFTQNYYMPRSEYMFQLVQPVLDDILFLSKSFDYYFDRCEAFFALLYFDHMGGNEESGWGPPGRFAWKIRWRRGNVTADMIKEAEAKRESWGPINAGLFGGSYERFSQAANGYLKIVQHLPWH